MEDKSGSSGSAGHAVQEAAASFLSKLKNKYRTSQGAVDLVVKEVNGLTGLHIDFLKENLSEKLAFQDGYLTLESIFAILDTLRGQSVFQGVQSQPYLDSFVAHRSSDNLPFGLTQIVFDWKVVFCRGVSHKVPKDYAYFPPFLKQLEQLLNCKDVLHCVDNPRPSQDGVFRNVTDGYFYRFHFVVQKHGNKVLSIVIHVDDVEFADPCKSKTKKHKLRMYYWSLGNIYPELRSTLKSINLLAIARYEVAIKYGNEEILKYFVKNMQELAEGVEFTINGEKRIFHGILQFVAADIPAAANLGGFKESHFALRPCRICMATRFELCEHFEENYLLLRRIEEHKKYVQQVQSKTPVTMPTTVSLSLTQTDIEVFDSDEEEQEFIQDVNPAVTYSDHPDPSVNYGINSRSALADVPGFDLTKCLPFDPLHVFFEGIGELLCRLILLEICTPRPVHLQDPTSSRDQSETPAEQPQDSSSSRKRKRTPAEQQEEPTNPRKGKRRQAEQPQSSRRKGKRTATEQPEEPTNPSKRKRTPTEKPKVSLKRVNEILQECCDFGHLHGSKPSMIEKSHLTSKLKQSASQMIVLIHILAVIAHNNVSEEKLNLLGDLIKLIASGMKFEVSDKDMDDLDSAIISFGEKFVRLYPQYKTLKLHSLKHLRLQITLHGPLRQQGCFRYEGMHREFTRLVDIINNMKNIEFSLACRHLCARNAEIMDGRADGTFLYEGDTIRKSPLVKLSSLPEKEVICTAFPDFDSNVDVSDVSLFKKHGRTWKKDVVISLPSNGVPGFGIINKIFLISEEMVFLLNKLRVNHLTQLNAFQIQGRDHATECIRLSDLNMQFPIARFDVHFGINNTKSFLVSGSSGDIVA